MSRSARTRTSPVRTLVRAQRQRIPFANVLTVVQFFCINYWLLKSRFRLMWNVADVARSEAATIIATTHKEDAGPTNNWKSPEEMKAILAPILDGCMEGA